MPFNFKQITQTRIHFDGWFKNGVKIVICLDKRSYAEIWIFFFTLKSIISWLSWGFLGKIIEICQIKKTTSWGRNIKEAFYFCHHRPSILTNAWKILFMKNTVHYSSKILNPWCVVDLSFQRNFYFLLNEEI